MVGCFELIRALFDDGVLFPRYVERQRHACACSQLQL